jgi:hypothetical protein
LPKKLIRRAPFLFAAVNQRNAQKRRRRNAERLLEDARQRYSRTGRRYDRDRYRLLKHEPPGRVGHDRPTRGAIQKEIAGRQLLLTVGAKALLDNGGNIDLCDKIACPVGPGKQLEDII